jgi:Contractile injection system tube protein
MEATDFTQPRSRGADTAGMTKLKSTVPAGLPKAPPQRLSNLAPPPPIDRAAPSPARLKKVVIGSLDDIDLGVEAQYNPSEITIELSVPWSQQKTKGEQPYLEFTGSQGRSLSFELLFDGFERGASVQGAVDDLTELASVRDADSEHEDLRRPHVVAVAWGEHADNIPAVRGVIESLSTKYTMFFPDGRPARATCSIKIREAIDGVRAAKQ